MDDILIDAPQFRNRHQVFADRNDGGRFLASMLQKYKNLADALILAIPSGGVPVGLEISRELALPMDLIITRKLQIPGNTEAGFGAMTMDGKAFLNRDLLALLRLSEEEIEAQKKEVRQELARRNARFRNNRDLPDLTGRTVIMVDDGLASGYTMMAAIAMLKNQGGDRIVVAIPTSPLSSIRHLQKDVEQIYCPNVQDAGPFAVASAYRHWRDLEATEVDEMLRRAGLLP